MQISKDEFLQWKTNVVTNEIYGIINQRIEDAKDLLSVVAGDEPDKDLLIRGMIQAFRDVLDLSWED